MFNMKVFMSKRMIACDEAAYLLSRKEEERLGFGRWMKLKMHLVSCHLCRKYARQLEQISRLMERYRKSTENECCLYHLDPSAGKAMTEEVKRAMNVK